MTAFRYHVTYLSLAYYFERDFHFDHTAQKFCLYRCRAAVTVYMLYHAFHADERTARYDDAVALDNAHRSIQAPFALEQKLEPLPLLERERDPIGLAVTQ